MHTRADARSLALHEEVARRLVADPAVLVAARARVQAWLDAGDRPYAHGWARVLETDAHEVARVIVQDSEQMRSLRQASPFAGAIDPRTRWRILARVTVES